MVFPPHLSLDPPPPPPLEGAKVEEEVRCEASGYSLDVLVEGGSGRTLGAEGGAQGESGTLESGTLQTRALENGALETTTLEGGTLESGTLESATLETGALKSGTLETGALEGSPRLLFSVDGGSPRLALADAVAVEVDGPSHFLGGDDSRVRSDPSLIPP